MDEKNVYIFTNIFHHWDLNRGPKRQYSLLEIEISATMDGKFQLFIHSKQKQFIFLTTARRWYAPCDMAKTINSEI